LIRGGDHRSPQIISRNPATNDRRHISLTNQTTNKQQHMANIKPLGQRVLVKRIEADAVSAGGIVLPDTAKEKPQEAEVLSLGTGGKDEDGKTIEFTVKVGDKVLISKYGGTEVKVDGQEVLIINESDILGIVA
jgi:chaperonin GroES